jgi:MFS family permease
VLAPRFGKLADERGPRAFLVSGALLIAAGLALFSFVESRADFWRFGVAGLAVFSVGLAALVAPITSTALAAAPERFSGIASGVNSTVSRLGNLLTVAVLGLVVLLVFKANGGADGVPFARGQHATKLRAASVDSFRVAMLIAAGLAVAGAVVALGVSDREARDARA